MKALLRTFFLCLCLPAAHAQPDGDAAAVRQDIGIFSGILEDALELSRGGGLFGAGLGGVEGVHLHGQGALFEIRSPLAARRNRVGLAGLDAAIPFGANPFDALARAAPAAPAAPSLSVDGRYRELAARIANIDYARVMNMAIQQAAQSARTLRSLDALDQDGYDALREELARARVEMEDNLDRLGRIEGDIRREREEPEGADETLSDRLDRLLAELGPQRERALAMADELKARMDQAGQEYARQWRRELDDFEAALFAALCDYGSALRALPAGQRVTLILKGLGRGEEDGGPPDRVHVLPRDDVAACGRGDLDAGALAARAVSYDY